MLKFWSKKPIVKEDNTESYFKSTHTLAERIEKRTAFKNKYPDSDYCVAVIQGLRDLPTNKADIKPYIVMGLQKSLTGLILISYLKKNLKITESLSLIILVGSNVVNMSMKVSQMGANYIDNDGFLYIRVKREDSF